MHFHRENYRFVLYKHACTVYRAVTNTKAKWAFFFDAVVNNSPEFC